MEVQTVGDKIINPKFVSAPRDLIGQKLKDPVKSCMLFLSYMQDVMDSVACRGR